MRIDYFCDIAMRTPSGRRIRLSRKLKSFSGITDHSDGSDFTENLDGALERIPIIGYPVSLDWNAKEKRLKARASFAAHRPLTDAELGELTAYVDGQFSDGYGEGVFIFEHGGTSYETLFLGNEIEGPFQYEDGVEVPPPDPDQRLIWAVSDGDMEAVKTALKAGASQNAKNRWGYCAFDLALGSEKKMPIASLLLDQGAEPTVHSLAKAAHLGALDLVEKLLARGSPLDQPVDFPDPFGRSPLGWAASRGDLDVVQMLLKAGADPNFQGEMGITPLMMAITTDIVDALLDAGADPELKTERGLNALEYLRNYFSFRGHSEDVRARGLARADHLEKRLSA